MAERGWLGLPYIAWAAICLGVATIWVFLWPHERAGGAGPLRYFLIRWGHALTWALLGLLCLLKLSSRPEIVGAANFAGLGALAFYLGFLAASFVFR